MTRSSRRRAGLLAVLLVGATLGLGCTGRVGDLTFVSTRNIDLDRVELDVRGGKRVLGSDCRYRLLGLVPLGGLPTLEGAVDDALEQGGGNVMVDQVTYVSSYWFVLVSRWCIRAEGTVLDTTAPGS